MAALLCGLALLPAEDVAWAERYAIAPTSWMLRFTDVAATGDGRWLAALGATGRLQWIERASGRIAATVCLPGAMRLATESDRVPDWSIVAALPRGVVLYARSANCWLRAPACLPP